MVKRGLLEVYFVAFLLKTEAYLPIICSTKAKRYISLMMEINQIGTLRYVFDLAYNNVEIQIKPQLAIALESNNINQVQTHLTD
tara:strand:+ start:30 stop:281 length:252 start_codon:yes stop_codon:yes gene_type:complete